jgi:CHASE3 domain sensor protein
MRVGTKLNLMGAGAAGIILIIATTSYISVSSLIEANKTVSHTKDVLQELNLLLYNLADAVTTQRGYVITGQEIYLDAYRANIASTNQSMADVRQLVADNPIQSLRADKLSALIKERLASLEVTTQLYQQKGMDAAFNRIRTGKSLQFRVLLHKAIDEMKKQEIELLQKRSEELKASVESTKMTIVAGALLGLVAAILSNYLFARYILNCINQLVKASDNIRYGRFDLSTSTNSNDEFAELAGAFNTVGHQLLDVTKTLNDKELERQKLCDAIEQSTNEVRQLRAKLLAVTATPSEEEQWGEHASELAEIFTSLNDIGLQLERSTRSMHELMFRLGRSTNRAEDSAASLISWFSSKRDSGNPNAESFLKAEEEVTQMQESARAFEHLISSLEMLDMSIDLEQARAGAPLAVNSLIVQRLKDVVGEAKQDRIAFDKGVSNMRSVLSKMLKYSTENEAAIAEKKHLAEKLSDELSRQSDLYRELGDSGIEDIVQNYMKFISSKRVVPDRIGKNIDNSREFIRRLQSILRETNQSSKVTSSFEQFH